MSRRRSSRHEGERRFRDVGTRGAARCQAYAASLEIAAIAHALESSLGEPIRLVCVFAEDELTESVDGAQGPRRSWATESLKDMPSEA